MKKSDVVPIEKVRAVAKPKPVKWRDFIRFVAECDKLREYYDDLWKQQAGTAEWPRSSTDFDDEDAEWCENQVAKCKAGLERFNRRENLDDPDDDESELSQAYIAKRLTLMVASFPNANPSSPEGYLQMLVEHVSAIEGLNEFELESACREIVETQKFAPAISEMLESIDKHAALWRERRHAMRNANSKRLEVFKTLVEREQKEKKEAHERAIQSATYALHEWTSTVQRLSKEIENAKAEAKAAAEAAETEIANLVERYHEAERCESEEMRKLEALTTNGAAKHYASAE